MSEDDVTVIRLAMLVYTVKSSSSFYHSGIKIVAFSVLVCLTPVEEEMVSRHADKCEPCYRQVVTHMFPKRISRTYLCFFGWFS